VNYDALLIIRPNNVMELVSNISFRTDRQIVTLHFIIRSNNPPHSVRVGAGNARSAQMPRAFAHGAPEHQFQSPVAADLGGAGREKRAYAELINTFQISYQKHITRDSLGHRRRHPKQPRWCREGGPLRIVGERFDGHCGFKTGAGTNAFILRGAHQPN
jgi:hypothetical protein